MVFNNPQQTEQYKLLDTTNNNKSSGYTIQNLITNQLNRMDYLRTIPISSTESNPITILSAIKYALRSLESKLYPFIENDTHYKNKVTPIKEKLKKRIDNIDETMETLSEWEDLIVSKLGLIDLLPQQGKDFEFDKLEE